MSHAHVFDWCRGDPGRHTECPRKMDLVGIEVARCSCGCHPKRVAIVGGGLVSPVFFPDGLPPGPMSMAVMTRPQDWEERARSILWPRLGGTDAKTSPLESGG